MSTSTDWELDGAEGRVVVRVWPNPDARYAVLLAHGYGEHSGRYEHVADHLVEHGATVFAPDHLGHGRSEGQRALVADMEHIVADLHLVADRIRSEHPGLPLVLVGHSMGGLLATRYAQQHHDELAALVLSGPVIGGNPAFEPLLQMDEIPDIPIDPEVLSRDPQVGEAYAADELVYHGPFLKPTLQSLFGAVGAVGSDRGFDELPTLWIHGEEDALAPYEVTKAVWAQLRGPGGQEKVYPGARHEIFNETNRDEVLADVTTFIDGAVKA
jgi:alpha-beta hydrolase superfamily lysophospholipase